MLNSRFATLLREAMSRKDIKPADLARQMHISRQIVYKWLAGHVLPSYKHSLALEELLDIQAYPTSNVLRHSRSRMRIPLIEGEIANTETGAVGLASQNVVEPSDWLVLDFPLSDGSVALRIRGDSMEPEFHDGEVVVVDPSIEPQSGDFVVAEVTDHALGRLWMFKQFRLRGHHDGLSIFDLVAINPLYKTITIGPSLPGRVVGTMVEHRRHSARLRARLRSGPKSPSDNDKTNA